MAIPCPICFPKAWELYKSNHPERAPWKSDQTIALSCCGRHPSPPEGDSDG